MLWREYGLFCDFVGRLPEALRGGSCFCAYVCRRASAVRTWVVESSGKGLWARSERISVHVVKARRKVTGCRGCRIGVPCGAGPCNGRKCRNGLRYKSQPVSLWKHRDSNPGPSACKTEFGDFYRFLSFLIFCCKILYFNANIRNIIWFCFCLFLFISYVCV